MEKCCRDDYNLWAKSQHTGDLKDSAAWIDADYLVRKESNAETEAWFVKILRNNDNNLTVFVTNLVQLWIEELISSDLKVKIKALNPNLEGDYKLFTNFIIGLLSNQEHCSKIIVDFGKGEDSYLKINLTSSFENVPFHWEFDGTLCTPQKTREIVMDPLLCCLAQYQRREKILMELINQKDKEIYTYASRIGTNTESSPKFSASEFHKSDEGSDDFFTLCKRQKLDAGLCFRDGKFQSMITEIESVDRFLRDFKPIDEENDLNINEHDSKVLPPEKPSVKKALKCDEGIGSFPPMDERPPLKRKQILRL